MKDDRRYLPSFHPSSHFLLPSSIIPQSSVLRLLNSDLWHLLSALALHQNSCNPVVYFIGLKLKMSIYNVPQISNSYLMLTCLTFNTHFGYKCFMQQTNEIKTSLKREYYLYSNAMVFYKNTFTNPRVIKLGGKSHANINWWRQT